MKFKLKIKFIALIVFLVTIIMVNVIYFFTIRQIDENRISMENHMNQLAQNIATMQLRDEQNWSNYEDDISRLARFNPDIIYIAIFDNRNALRAFTLNTDLIELESSNISRKKEAEIIKFLDSGSIARENKDDLHTVLVDIQIGERILGSVHVGFSLIKINEALRYNISLNILLALIFILIFSTITIFITQKLTRPLEDLNEAMENVQQGNFETTVSVKSSDEIAELTRTFNSMVEFMREHQIIDALGDEIKTVFRLETLAPIVRERLKNAIGAGSARLYIRSKDNPRQFEEVTQSGQQKSLFPAILLDNRAEMFLKEHNEGFMIQDISKAMRRVLKHNTLNENGLVIPLIIKEVLFGVVYFSLPETKGQFSEKEKRFAITLTNHAALALENAFLYEELQEQERLKRELEIARQIQLKLLPPQIPTIPQYDLHALCKTAYEVGGDYYDFFKISDQKIAVLIADVSGKGAFASFYMAEMKGMMLQLVESELSVEDLVKELNKKLYSQLEKYAFITMVYGILDVKKHTFNFSRTGHTSPLWMRADGTHELLTPSGIGLGLENGLIFNKQVQAQEITLKPGDSILLYTDGLNEAMNSSEEEYGMKRVINTVDTNRYNPSKAIVNALCDDVSSFQGTSTNTQDDMTIIAIKREQINPV